MVIQEENNELDDVQYSSGYPGVVITDIDMPFLSMVLFMIKWAIPSVPVIIILSVLFFGLIAIFGGATYLLLP